MEKKEVILSRSPFTKCALEKFERNNDPDTRDINQTALFERLRRNIGSQIGISRFDASIDQLMKKKRIKRLFNPDLDQDKRHAILDELAYFGYELGDDRIIVLPDIVDYQKKYNHFNPGLSIAQITRICLEVLNRGADFRQPLPTSTPEPKVFNYVREVLAGMSADRFKGI